MFLKILIIFIYLQYFVQCNDSEGKAIQDDHLHDESTQFVWRLYVDQNTSQVYTEILLGSSQKLRKVLIQTQEFWVWMECFDCRQDLELKNVCEKNVSAYDIKNSSSGSIGQCWDKQFFQNYNCDHNHCDKKTSQCQYLDASGQIGAYGFDYFFLNNHFNQSTPFIAFSQIKVKFTMLCVQKYYQENYQGSVGLGENLLDIGSQSLVRAIYLKKQDQYKKFSICANKLSGFISFSGQPIIYDQQLKIPYQRYYEYTYGIRVDSIKAGEKKILVGDYKFVIASGFVNLVAPRTFIDGLLSVLPLEIDETMEVKGQSANLPFINFEFPSGVFAWNPSNYLIIKNNNTYLPFEISEFESDVVFLGSKFMEEQRFQFDMSQKVIYIERHNCTNEKIFSQDFIFQIQASSSFDPQILIIFGSILCFFLSLYLIYRAVMYYRKRKTRLLAQQRSKKYELELQS